MKNINDTLRKTLEEKATEYLNTKFTLTEFAEDSNHPDQYKVHGTILRYDVPVNVEVTFVKDGLEPRYWLITDESITMLSRYIGAIKLSKDVCVTDPCYNRDVWCMTQLNNVKPGLWDVHASIDEIDFWGKRTYILELFHRDSIREQIKELSWKECAELGVDSGQMSVFDDAYYRRKNGSEADFEADESVRDSFYDTCCNLSQNYVGIYRAGNRAVGVVCSSGCGDGSYPLEVKEIDGKIVAMKISFM